MRRLVALVAVCWPVFLAVQVQAAPALSPPLRLPYGGGRALLFRDDYGVPHLLADTDGALYFGDGYAIAEDRLIQMAQFRAMALGELAAALGAEYIEDDIRTRTVGYTAEELADAVAALPAEVRESLTAYAAGVNHYVETLQGAGGLAARLGPFAATWRAWTPTDSAAVDIAMSRRFGLGGTEELPQLRFYQTLHAALGDGAAAVFDDFVWWDDPAAPTTIRRRDDNGRLPAPPAVAANRDALLTLPATLLSGAQDALQMPMPGSPQRLARLGDLRASYAILLAPERTASRAPILLGGPQMGFESPAVAHEVHLMGPGVNVIGMSFAGVPGVLLGHNDHLAWTATSGVGNLVDFFIETLDRNDPSRYRFRGSVQPMLQRTETIAVAGGRPVTVTVRRSVHGPIINADAAAGLATALAFPAWGKELDTLTALYRSNRARSLTELGDLLPLIGYSFNFFAASTTGDIAYWYVGQYPVRADNVDPRFPVPGTGEFEWRGVMPSRDLPHLVNPRDGYLVNWNNRPSPSWPSSVWGASHHMRSIERAAQSRDIWTPEQLADLQRTFGLTDPLAVTFRPALLDAVKSRHLDRNPEFAGVIRALEAWDERVLEGSLGPTAMRYWLRQALDDTFGDDLAGLATAWRFDVRTMDFPDPFTDVLAHALNAPVDRARKLSWDYLNAAKWQDVMAGSFERGMHRMLEETGSTLDAVRQPRRMINFEGLAPIPYTSRGTFIQVVELRPDGPHGMSVLPPGQSELPGHPHQADQRDLAGFWQYKPMRLGRAEWERRATDLPPSPN